MKAIAKYWRHIGRERATTALMIMLGGLLADASLAAFAASACLAVAFQWYRWFMRHPARTVFVNLAPEAGDNRILLQGIQQALVWLQAPGAKEVALRVLAPRTPGGRVLTLDLNSAGDLRISGGSARATHLKRPGIWLAEHPLPLTIPSDTPLTLRLSNTSGGRVKAALL